ncbi:MAG: RluA family pseudouridine synthase [Sphingorhabdus sp.]
MSTSKDVRQFNVGIDDDGIRLDRWFKRHMADAPFALVSRWARTGQLRLDGKRVQVSDRIATGQTIRVPPVSADAIKKRTARRRIELSAEQIEMARSLVIHRDRAALVLNKPPGLATQGGTKISQHIDGLLDAYCEEDDEPRPRLVHRLDKDTSGALLVARSPGSAAYFSKHFSGRSARKTYWALVMGVPDVKDGVIELPLAKQPGTGGEKMYVDEVEGQTAKSRYRVIEIAGDRCAWVELTPFTGRTHQLRVHMAAIGHPIVGDGKYGGKEAFLTGSISRKMHLHARAIKIGHPDGGKIYVRADPPKHFLASLGALGFDPDAGDLPDDEKRPPMTRAKAKQVARHHSKQIRKERRGERRGRADAKAATKAGTKVGRGAKAGARAKDEKPKRRPPRPTGPVHKKTAGQPRKRKKKF